MHVAELRRFCPRGGGYETCLSQWLWIWGPENRSRSQNPTLAQGCQQRRVILTGSQ